MLTPDVASAPTAEAIYSNTFPKSKTQSKIDWLQLEREIRNFLSDQDLDPAMRLQLIDMSLAVHTGRGSEFQWQGCK